MRRARATSSHATRALCALLTLLLVDAAAAQRFYALDGYGSNANGGGGGAQLASTGFIGRCFIDMTSRLQFTTLLLHGEATRGLAIAANLERRVDSGMGRCCDTTSNRHSCAHRGVPYSHHRSSSAQDRRPVLIANNSAEENYL